MYISFPQVSAAVIATDSNPHRPSASCTTLSSGPRRCRSHLTPCCCGSTTSGQRSLVVRMAVFSMDIRSFGKPWLCQAATAASSVSMRTGSRPSVRGTEDWNRRRDGQWVLSERWALCCGRVAGRKCFQSLPSGIWGKGSIRYSGAPGDTAWWSNPSRRQTPRQRGRHRTEFSPASDTPQWSETSAASPTESTGDRSQKPPKWRFIRRGNVSGTNANPA